MPNRVILVRHGDDPPDDRVHTFLLGNGFEPVIRKPFSGETLGTLDGSIAGSVIYGGPFVVTDSARHPFLDEERGWIEACMKADLPLLGICQGAQQIAHHLGATVGPAPGGPCEFGYYEVAPDAGAGDFLDRPVRFTQSHYHTFETPQGAQRLAGSALFPNQAFRAGRLTYALQFHPEVTIQGFRRWQDLLKANYGRPGAQTREEQDALMLDADREQAAWFYGFLETLFGKAERRQQS